MQALALDEENIIDDVTIYVISYEEAKRFHFIDGKRCYYELKLPENILKEHKDIVLEFDFDGLNLQVFSGNQIINDYFNIDRKFIMNLLDYKKYIEKDSMLIIRTAPKTRFGVSNVYNEIEIPLHSNALTLASARVIKTEEVKTA